jgi:tetratricopeptide (TPR) repeat protein
MGPRLDRVGAVLDAGKVRRLAVVIALVIARGAHADPPPPLLPEPAAEVTEASAMFQRGRDLAKAGRYAEACPLFDRSYALEPALGTALNLADCLERAGELRRAWQLFDRVARESPSAQSRAKLARDRADALDAKLGHLTIRLRAPAAAGLTLALDERALVPAPALVERIDPGAATVIARVPGQPAFRARVHATAGEAVVVDVPAFAAPAAPDLAPIPAPIAETRRRRARVYLAGGLAAAGVAGLAASLGVGLSARHTYNAAFDHHACTDLGDAAACTPAGRAMIDRAGARADLATGLAIGGAALVAAGAVALFTAPRETIQVAPIASPETIGLGLTGRF